VPELPEVETVRRDLAQQVVGARVTRVEVLRAKMVLDTGHGLDVLHGEALLEAARHGKCLILRFSGGHTLLVHFRMTGQLYPLPPEAELPRHTRTVLHLADGRRLVHVDLRTLGTLELIPTRGESESRSLAGLGPDALDAMPAAADLWSALHRRRSVVKVALLDQRLLAGLGNIYVAEALWRAGVDPRTRCHRLTHRQVGRLHAAIVAVLAEAVDFRGTTVSDYRTGTGGTGGFQCRLGVYGRGGASCLREACPGVIRRIVQAQRSTWFCPSCQRR
jgi:formamidopyrimidine-DNA glycosylase